MHDKTKELRNRMLQYEDIPDRLVVLRDAYKGETCYIVTVGPSIKNYEEDYLRDKLKDKLIITVKQAYNIFRELSDFQVLSFANFNPYTYSSDNTMVVWEVFEQYHPQIILENGFKCELMLPVVGNHEPDIKKRQEQSQAGTLSFDDWTLDKTINRMYGPTIMYETVFHLAIYLGVKEIITLGWDIADMNIFKNKDPYEDVFNDHFYQNTDYAIKIPANYTELSIVVNSTKFFYEWLKSKNIDLKVISDRSAVNEIVPRIELQESL
tara:strand:+ start:158 stop:955 length:798 start_codon:yes stop_codon:yes gene_type:complete